MLNKYDEFTNDWTFEDFQLVCRAHPMATYFNWRLCCFRHREQESATDLFILYLWHVTNTENFIEGGYKPRLQEKGPFAYTRQAYKYGIASGSVQKTKRRTYVSIISRYILCRIGLKIVTV